MGELNDKYHLSRPDHMSLVFDLPFLCPFFLSFIFVHLFREVAAELIDVGGLAGLAEL